jgi:hypothetical protein
VVWQFFRHGIEVLVYVVFVSVIGLAIERIVAQPLPAQLGGNNPFAHVLMMGACCVAAVALLRHVRRDLASAQPQQRGMLSRAGDVALGMGMQAAVGGVGGAAISGVKGLKSRLGQGPRPPWEQLETGAGSASGALGEPRPGFNPVPGPQDGSGATSGSGTPAAPDGGARVGGEADSGGATSPRESAAVSSVSPIVVSVGQQSVRRSGRAAGGGPRGSAVQTEGSSSVDSSGNTSGPAGSIPPITWATTGYGEDVPPNLEPPEAEPGPPDDGPGHVDGGPHPGF